MPDPLPPAILAQARRELAAQAGRAKTPAKAAACRRNLAKAQKALTPAQRRDRARKAAAARWAAKKGAPKPPNTAKK